MQHKIIVFALALIGLGLAYSIIAGLLIQGYMAMFTTGSTHHTELLFAPILAAVPACLHAAIIARRYKNSVS